MINICVLHCSNEEMQEILETIKNCHIRIGVKLFLVINPRYELDYFVRHRNMDIVILNASLVCNNYDGIFLAKRIKIINRNALIFFISKTTDENQLTNIISAEPFTYIKSKDILSELPVALNDAVSIVSKDTNIFTYFKRNEKNSVSLKKVIYFSSSHRIMKYICIDGREDCFYVKMDNAETIITKISNDFIRVNQSYLINIKFIILLIGNEITMINNHTIIISRKYRNSRYMILSKLPWLN